VIEHVVVVEVQFKQDLEIVAGPQSREITFDFDECNGQGVARRCVGEGRGHLSSALPASRP